MCICGSGPAEISEKDKARLQALKVQSTRKIVWKNGKDDHVRIFTQSGVHI
jgi:hypothetical protein